MTEEFIEHMVRLTHDLWRENFLAERNMGNKQSLAIVVGLIRGMCAAGFLLGKIQEKQANRLSLAAFRLASYRKDWTSTDTKIARNTYLRILQAELLEESEGAKNA